MTLNIPLLEDIYRGTKVDVSPEELQSMASELGTPVGEPVAMAKAVLTKRGLGYVVGEGKNPFE